MYTPNNTFKTIREAQIYLLQEILHSGDVIEDTLEINNISVCITHPMLYHGNLFENVTPIAEKHMSQMMIEKDCKSDKTHYNRLHNWETIPLCEIDQIEEVIKKLKENPFSKRCVITLWSPEDINDKYALSFTFCQLFIRNNQLIITNYFRSCDIYNAFTFNMLGIAKLQEQIAERLGVETSEFNVHIGSAHIYKVHIEKIKDYLNK
jgi:thymidylate synthase